MDDSMWNEFLKHERHYRDPEISQDMVFNVLQQRSFNSTRSPIYLFLSHPEATLSNREFTLYKYRWGFMISYRLNYFWDSKTYFEMCTPTHRYIPDYMDDYVSHVYGDILWNLVDKTPTIVGYLLYGEAMVRRDLLEGEDDEETWELEEETTKIETVETSLGLLSQFISTIDPLILPNVLLST